MKRAAKYHGNQHTREIRLVPDTNVERASARKRERPKNVVTGIGTRRAVMIVGFKKTADEVLLCKQCLGLAVVT